MNLTTHYAKITALCHLLNGRTHKSEYCRHYETGYEGQKVGVRTIDGQMRVVRFFGIDFYYMDALIEFNNERIHLEMKEDGNEFKFRSEKDRETAEAIFGKGVSAGSIIFYTETALKQQCIEYANQINETIQQIH